MSKREKVRKDSSLYHLKQRYLDVWLELTKSDMTTLWVHKEFEIKSQVMLGSAQWISSGIRLSEKQYVSQCLVPVSYSSNLVIQDRISCRSARSEETFDSRTGCIP